ncbi:MAG: tetratricopeptide repeat protein [Flavobacteriales bacterium]|nr:tetratricopeptide repeat protein [Flavobacteriales bacterium]
MIARSLLAALVALSTPIAAQPDLDSLYRIWQDPSRPDSIRVKAYLDRIWNGYLYSMPDSAIALAEALQDYAREHDYPMAAGSGYNIQGVAHANQSNYARAMECYEKALAIRREIGDRQGTALSLNNIGIVYSDQGDLPRALDYYTQALKIQEEIGNRRGMAMALNNIGLLINDQSEAERAMDHYERALAIYEELGDERGAAQTLGNLGIVLFGQKKYARALESYEKALVMQEELGDRYGQANALGNISLVHDELGDHTSALAYYEKALPIFEELADKEGIAASLNNMGSIYLKQGTKSLALKYCLEGLALAREIDVLAQQQSGCQCLYDAYKAIGDDAKALEYHEQMVVLKDSLFNEENTKKITQLEMQYEFDKKEAATQAEQEKKDAVAAQELSRQKVVRNGFMGGFVLVALFAVVFLTQRNRIGKEKKRSEELLLNILPEEVAEELKLKGEAEAKLIDQVTVLFTDFKGFTAMSERLSPKELVKDLHECFSAFDNICEKYGIEKIKTIGDAYMAAGGLPTPNTTHAMDVIEAALEMRDFIAEGKARKIAAGLPYFEIRIGIHTGPVVAGIVGVKKFSYDIWGDTVNTASRMESSGDVGQVNLSEATYEIVKHLPGLTFTPRGKVQAKGKGEMEMYFVERTELLKE